MLQLELWRPALLALLLLGAHAAAAQDFINPGENAYASATPEDVRSGSAIAAPKIVDRVPLELDPAELSKALSSEPPIFEKGKVKTLSRHDDAAATAKWNRVDNPDGSASYSVNKALAAPWDAKIGADVSTAAPLPDASDPRRLPTALPSNAGSGSAWANVAVPHVATVEVRAEPGNGYDKIGTKFERSLPLGKSFSVTAQSTLGIIETRPTPGAATPSADAAARLFSTDNSLQLNVLATGTSFAAGTTTATGDPITHSRFSAGQKVYGPLNITGTVNDPGQASKNMSLTAGMNFNW
jgi:hypothetical protein